MTTASEVQERTKAFAVRVVRLVRSLPYDVASNVVGRQLLRAATSVGANYRAACRARSTREFIAKLGIVEEEADESLYWLELLIATETMDVSRLQPLMEEATEILSIVVASIRTARKNNPR